ncbi:MAG: DUF4124 domain-containing protein, partial [Betaproteobacteria bacterium]
AWLLAVAGMAHAQAVIKCVDADGNITYQNSACQGGQAGRRIELPKAESQDEAGVWEAAAKEARVIPGMPKRWVLRARGAPLEIRAGTARDNATEVWRYASRDNVTLIGFAGANVAWQRDEALARDATPPPDASAAKVATETTASGAQNRRFVIAGRSCDHVFAEIGRADRQEPLPAGTTGTRYIYEPLAADPQMRTSFNCVGGKVADVERILVR